MGQGHVSFAGPARPLRRSGDPDFWFSTVEVAPHEIVSSSSSRGQSKALEDVSLHALMPSRREQNTFVASLVVCPMNRQNLFSATRRLAHSSEVRVSAGQAEEKTQFHP